MLGSGSASSLAPGDPGCSPPYPLETTPALAAPSWFDVARHRPGTDPRVYRELGSYLRYRVDCTLAIELDGASARLGGGGR
eukprot:scaffold31044_cov33-Phaeocystis_antarctica.AAC.1